MDGNLVAYEQYYPEDKKMKPHFGQSDAAMNKLAGCNKFPNASKGLEQIADLEAKAKEAGFETPLEYLKAKHEEAAGMGLEPMFFECNLWAIRKMQPSANMTENMTPVPLPKGYYGHEDGCDCAVCEEMQLAEQRQKLQADREAKIRKLFELVEAAYFKGWKDGSETGESDSPDWNASEDWVETEIRAELKKIEEALEI